MERYCQSTSHENPLIDSIDLIELWISNAFWKRHIPLLFFPSLVKI